MIAILLQLIVGAIIIGVVLWLIQQIPGVAPFANIIRVVIIAVFVIYVIYLLMAMLGGGHLPEIK